MLRITIEFDAGTTATTATRSATENGIGTMAATVSGAMPPLSADGLTTGAMDAGPAPNLLLFGAASDRYEAGPSAPEDQGAGGIFDTAGHSAALSLPAMDAGPAADIAEPSTSGSPKADPRPRD